MLDIVSAFGLSASAGLNAYIPLLVIALLAKFTSLIHLNKPWDALTSWWTIGILVVLSLIEFFADKIPAVNHVNDIVHTLVRPVAGAIAFAASAQIITDVHPVLALFLGLVISGTVHAVKSVAVRPAVSAATAGMGNVPVSILEDLIATITSILSILVPVVIGIFLVLIVAMALSIYFRRRRKTALES